MKISAVIKKFGHDSREVNRGTFKWLLANLKGRGLSFAN